MTMQSFIALLFAACSAITCAESVGCPFSSGTKSGFRSLGENIERVYGPNSKLVLKGDADGLPVVEVPFPGPPLENVIDPDSPDFTLLTMNGMTLQVYDNTRFSLVEQFFTDPSAGDGLGFPLLIGDSDMGYTLYVADTSDFKAKLPGLRAALEEAVGGSPLIKKKGVSNGQKSRVAKEIAVSRVRLVAAGNAERVIPLVRVAVPGDLALPPIYTHLKDVAHTTLMTTVLLDPSFWSGFLNGSSVDTAYLIPASALANLKAYREQVAVAHTQLKSCCNFTATQISYISELIMSTLSFHDLVLAQKSVSRSMLFEFGNRTIHYIELAAYDAAYAQVVSLNDIVNSFRSVLTPGQWSGARAIQFVSHMARQCETRLQYWSRVFDNSPITSGYRVVAAEHLSTEADALQLFGTHLNDFTAGRFFFHDADRMHEDLLATFAARALDKLLPSTNSIAACPAWSPSPSQSHQ